MFGLHQTAIIRPCVVDMQKEMYIATRPDDGCLVQAKHVSILNLL